MDVFDFATQNDELLVMKSPCSDRWRVEKESPNHNLGNTNIKGSFHASYQLLHLAVGATAKDQHAVGALLYFSDDLRHLPLRTYRLPRTRSIHTVPLPDNTTHNPMRQPAENSL